jgi:hypothetical protein
MYIHEKNSRPTVMAEQTSNLGREGINPLFEVAYQNGDIANCAASRGFLFCVHCVKVPVKFV